MKSEVESRSDCKLLWDQKGPEQTEDHESRAEQKKPHFSAESKDKWVYLPRFPGGRYLRKIPSFKESSFLSGPGFTGTRVAVLPPAVKMWRSNHWTTREFPKVPSLKIYT